MKSQCHDVPPQDLSLLAITSVNKLPLKYNFFWSYTKNESLSNSMILLRSVWQCEWAYNTFARISTLIGRYVYNSASAVWITSWTFHGYVTRLINITTHTHFRSPSTSCLYNPLPFLANGVSCPVSSTHCSHISPTLMEVLQVLKFLYIRLGSSQE